MDEMILQLKILIEEFSRPTPIRLNPTHLSRRHKNIFRTLLIKKPIHRRRIQKIQLLPGPADYRRIAQRV